MTSKLEFAKVCVYLKLYKVPDLSRLMKLDYLELKSDLIKDIGIDEYTSVTKGSTGAMGKARKATNRVKIEIDDRSLVETLELMLMKRYTVYDLSNLLEVDIEDLLDRSRKVAENVRFFEKSSLEDLARFQNLTISTLESISSKEDFKKFALVREWELDDFLDAITLNAVESKRFLLNSWGNKSMTDRQLEALVRRRENGVSDSGSLEISNLRYNYRDEESESDEDLEDLILQLFEDRFRLEEIAKILKIDERHVSKVFSDKELSPRRWRRSESEKIKLLHFDRVSQSGKIKEIEDLVRQGRLTLDDACEELMIPRFFKNDLTRCKIFSQDSVKKGASSFAARNVKKKISNVSALKNLEDSEDLKDLFSEELQSRYYSERLYQISRLRQVSDRKQLAISILDRIEKSRFKKERGFANFVMKSLQVDLTETDSIEFSKRYQSFEFSLRDSSISRYERKVLEILDDLEIKYVLHDRSIFKYDFEIDILIEDLKLGIEISPISSHHSNQINDRFFDPKNEKYHYRKYLNAKSSGYELLTLYEYDLSNEVFEKITKQFLINKLQKADKSIKIYARETTFEEISKHEAKRFIEMHHRDGYVPSTHEFCLRDRSGSIAAVATVLRKTDSIYELSRLAIDSSIVVVGATSKLVKNLFRSIDDLNELITFSDNDRGDGSSYLKSGFTFVSETGPRKIYLSKSDPVNDRYVSTTSEELDFRNQNLGFDLDHLFMQTADKDDFELEKYIETELPHRTDDGKGYDRLYTSGSKKWKIERSDLF